MRRSLCIVADVSSGARRSEYWTGVPTAAFPYFSILSFLKFQNNYPAQPSASYLLPYPLAHYR